MALHSHTCLLYTSLVLFHQLAQHGEAYPLIDAQLFLVAVHKVVEPHLDVEGKEVKAFSNDMVWLHDFVDCNEEELGIYERVRFSVLRQLMEEHQRCV